MTTAHAASDPARRAVSPRAALAHPLFVAALAVLALNDHVLKGSGLLPGVLTGKLSDVAGLIVAPAVLGWLLSVRTERAWRGVHVAVGAAFALVQLPFVAAALEELARALGIGARLWPDATDLLALPALLASHRWLGRAGGARPRAAMHTALGLGALVFCAATPAPGGSPAPRYPFPPAGILETDAFVRHTGDEDLEIAVRRLREGVTVDCDGLLDVPERMLEGGDFGDEERWTLARGDAVPLWDRRGGATDRECYAVRLKARGREWLVSWRHGAPAVASVDIRLEPNVPAEDGAIVIAVDPETPPRVPEGVHVVRAP